LTLCWGEATPVGARHPEYGVDLIQFKNWHGDACGVFLRPRSNHIARSDPPVSHRRRALRVFVSTAFKDIMIQRGPSIFSRNFRTLFRTQSRRDLLDALESAISIAVSMTLFSLVAFSTFSGA
jgi:hypothetical protein